MTVPPEGIPKALWDALELGLAALVGWLTRYFQKRGKK